MKNKTLLKVLSASAIFTAIAAIESYDHNAFATEVTATANNNQSDVETKTVPQDVKNLPDGTYSITSEALHFSQEGKQSMAAAGLDNEKTKLIVKNGQYFVNVNFKPISLSGLNGYLGDLKYYAGDKTHKNRYDIEDNEFKDTTIVNNYSENENDTYTDIYKKKFPGRTVYPKTLSYSVDKNKIDSNNKLETFTQVFVPVMESIFQGAGTQRMILEYNLSSLATKTITEAKYNLVPLTMMDATANTKSMGDGSIEKTKTRVEKVGDTYHYYVTAKDLAFGPFVGELTNLTVNGSPATLTELGGSNHEKLYHFTSKEKYDVVNITVDVASGGRPFHKNTPARFAFDWAKATPLTKDIVNQLQNEEKAKANEKVAADKKANEEKARIEAEKLARENAEKARIEAERLANESAEKARIEAEKLARENAEKARIEAEKLARENAEKARIEAERLAKENAEKVPTDAEKLAKENAEKSRIEVEKLSKEKLETEKLEKLKSKTINKIMKDSSISEDEKEKLKTIIKTATLKDTLVASINNDDNISDITVSFNNTDIKATQFIAVKADEENATKVESLVKNTDEKMQVIKTIDLHFKDEKGNIIDKKGETRTVTVALLANENEKIEVYYVNDNNLEKIPSIYKDGKLTFFTNHFSLYTIIKNITPTNTPTSYKDNALVQSVLPEFNKNSLTNNTDSEATKSNVQEIKHVATNNKTLAKTGTTTTATGFLGLISLLSAVTLRRKTNK